MSLGLAVIGVIIWAIRQEGILRFLERKQDIHDREIHEMKLEVKEIGLKLVEELSKIRVGLGRLEERLVNIKND